MYDIVSSIVVKFLFFVGVSYAGVYKADASLLFHAMSWNNVYTSSRMMVHQNNVPSTGIPREIPSKNYFLYPYNDMRVNLI